MVGLVLVSHSRKLAEATVSLVRAMSGEEVPIAVAAGAGDDREDLGTDAMEIHQAVVGLLGREGSRGVAVIMDMGSAVISADMAMEFLEPEHREKVRLCPSAFVEGAIAAGVACKIGNDLESVIREAKAALRQKTEHLEEGAGEDQRGSERLEAATEATDHITVPIPGGLHMRPVAELAQIAAKYQADIQIKNLTNGKGPASARSMTEVLGIAARYGNRLQISASGVDAATAVGEAVRAVRAGLGDALAIEEKPTAAPEVARKALRPVGISRGIAIAPAHYLGKQNLTVPDETAENPERETESLEAAIKKAKEYLLQKSGHADRGSIFRAQAALLDDPSILERTKRCILGKKRTAASAWHRSLEETIAQYQNSRDENLRQRTADLMDVRETVLQNLGIKTEQAEKTVLDREAVIIARDLTPNQVHALDGRFAKGVICTENAPTSHSAILLRARGIPSIVQAARAGLPLADLPPGTIVAMDGESGEISVSPDKGTLERFESAQKNIQKQQLQEEQNRLEPALTKDGRRITILANVGKPEDARRGRENGAEGIGLLRTEFMFLGRAAAPTEDEQVENLCRILEHMGDKPVVVRTLDAGGDKRMPYLDMPREENPFLGVRAIRLCLRNRPMFQAQLRAILRAGNLFDVSIMFPMIATMAELLAAKDELRRAHLSLTGENVPHKWPVETGIMVEVPSVAVMAEDFAREVDFFSIGTNDLVQYTLAADRGNPDLQASIGNGLDESVRRLISNVALAAKKAGISVSVCGEAASDPLLVPLLVSLGIDKLSMNPTAVPRIKLLLREMPSER